MEINIEYKKQGVSYPIFFESIKNKTVAVICDINTSPFAKNIVNEMNAYAKKIVYVEFPQEELIPDDDVVERVLTKAKQSDYVLAVGSGSLNDVAKFVSTKLGIDCGCLCTAASMDGYVSKGSALMEKGLK